MDFTQYYHIAFRHHDIMNPLSPDVLRQIGRLVLPSAGAMILDIGSGKGHVSLLCAKEFAARCVMVDSSEQWTAVARSLFDAEGIGQSAEIHTMDGGRFLPERQAYDLVFCLGTTPIFGGFSETLERLRDCLKPGGALAVGEISCHGPLPKNLRHYLHEHDWRIYEIQELLRGIRKQGYELELAFRSSHHEWDTYMSLQWKAITDYFRAAPGDSEAAAFADYARREQEMFLLFQRHHVDWNVFVMRTAQ